MANNINMICKHCGSESVLKDAWAKWDIPNQEWVLSQEFDEAFCENCDGSTSIKEVKVQLPNFHVLDEIHIRAYWKSMNTPEDALIEPSWYAEHGTPIDSEGDDMEYIETRLYKESFE